MPDDDALRRDFTFQLLLAARLWRRTSDGVLRDFGLTDATALPFGMIARSGGILRQRDLAAGLGIEAASLVPLLDQLCRLGLIRREEDPDDRRAKTLHLTKQGQDSIATIDAVLDRLRRDMLAASETADVAATLRVLAGLSAAAAIPERVPEAAR